MTPQAWADAQVAAMRALAAPRSPRPLPVVLPAHLLDRLEAFHRTAVRAEAAQVALGQVWVRDGQEPSAAKADALHEFTQANRAREAAALDVAYALADTVLAETLRAETPEPTRRIG